MKMVTKKNLNRANKALLDLVKSDGVDVVNEQRGSYRVLYNVMTTIKNPRDRWLSLPGRNSDVYATMAEVLWVLSGDININPWLSYWLPRAKLYSDNGSTWYSGYGQALRNFHGLQSVIDHLNEDPVTRKAVLSIYDPARETRHSVEQNLHTKSTKDNSCNNILYFYSKDGGKTLDLTVVNRSNDLIYGYPVNVAVFTMLQECVALLVGMELGEYAVYQNNTHYYTDNPTVMKQVNNIKDGGVYDDSSPVILPSWVTNAVELMGYFKYIILGISNVEADSPILKEVEETGGVIAEMTTILRHRYLKRHNPELIKLDESNLISSPGIKAAINQTNQWKTK